MNGPSRRIRFVEKLSRAQIDARAEATLQQAYGGAVPPGAVDIEALLETHYDLRLFIGKPAEIGETEGVLGAIFFERHEVFVNEGLLGAPGRYRFTLAHELGHWILHQDVVDPIELVWPLLSGQRFRGKGILCRAGDYSPIEFQANAFAAAILMPRWSFSSAVSEVAVAQRWKRHLSSYLISAHDHQALIQTLASNFGVSKEAAKYRLNELSLVTVGAPNQLGFDL